MEQDRDETSDLQPDKSMENKDLINYVSSKPPSLQNITAISIAINLWSHHDIKKHLERSDESKRKYNKLAKIVLEKLTNIFLPELLQKEVSNLVRPIGLQLLRCFSSDECYGHSVLRSPNIFREGVPVYWTTKGIVDEVKSIKELFNDVKICRNDLRHLACIHCLEGIVSNLSEEMCHLEGFLKQNGIFDSEKSLIFLYWEAVLKDDFTHLSSKIRRHENLEYNINYGINLNMTINAIRTRNMYAFNYFWSKMSEEERNSNLKFWLETSIKACEMQLHMFEHQFNSNMFEFQIYSSLCYDDTFCDYGQYYPCTEILCFLLSRCIDKDLLEELFRRHAGKILKSLFNSWPFQKYLLPTISATFDYISDCTYVSTMVDIVKEMKNEGTVVEQLFLDVWNRSPLHLKECFIKQMKISSWIFLSILKSGSSNTVTILLSNFSKEENKPIIFEISKEKGFIRDMVYANKLNMLDELMAFLTDDDIKAFKQCMMKHALTPLFSELTSIRNFHQIVEFMKWGFQSDEEIQRFKVNGINAIEIYISLMRLSNIKVVDKFMNWCFDTEEEMKDFKKTFITSIDKKQDLFGKFFKEGFFFDRSAEWNFFVRITNDCLQYCTSEDIKKFKKILIYKVKYFLFMGEYEFASLLLSWCSDTVDEIIRFKREYMLSKDGILLLVRHFKTSSYDPHIIGDIIKSYEKLDIRNTLKWFAPIANDTLAELKSLMTDTIFSNCFEVYTEAQTRNIFFNLLDSFVTKYNTPDLANDFGKECMFDIMLVNPSWEELE